jgi:ParB family chromosome partitioning protein
MSPDELVERPPFSTLFPRRPDVIERITKSMKNSGFDPSQAVHVWREGNCLIDGHQRRQAAIKAKVPIYVYFHNFPTEDEALDYAIAVQRDRRNLTDDELHSIIKVIDKRKAKGGDRKSKGSNGPIDPGRSADQTAATIGTSSVKVKKSRAVAAHPDLDQAVSNGEVSLNRAATEARKRNREAKKPANGDLEQVASIVEPKPKEESDQTAQVREWHRRFMAARPNLVGHGLDWCSVANNAAHDASTINEAIKTVIPHAEHSRGNPSSEICLFKGGRIVAVILWSGGADITVVRRDEILKGSRNP